MAGTMIGSRTVSLFELEPAGPSLLFRNTDRDHGVELWGLTAE